LRVEPVAGPWVDESERIAAVLEAAIIVIALAHTKPVFLSKIGPETVVGNAATTVTAGALRLLYRLSLLCVLLCVLLFLFAALVVLLCSFLFLLCVPVLLLRAFLFLFCRFFLL
jgi:hypothetical protein